MAAKEVKEKMLFSATSTKSLREVIDSIKANTRDFGFEVRHVFDMREEYTNHNVGVADDFQLYQIIVCNFQASYNSMRQNMERAAVIYQPKQITVYPDHGVTTVNYYPLSESCIAAALPRDEQFHKALSKACRKIIGIIEASV